MTSATRSCPASTQRDRASAAGVTSSSGSTSKPRRSSRSSVWRFEREVVLVTKRSPSSLLPQLCDRLDGTGTASSSTYRTPSRSTSSPSIVAPDQAAGSPTAAPEDPVDEARRVGAAVLLGELDRLVDRDLDRDLVVVERLLQRHPHDRALQGRDPLQRPALGVARDQLVELGAVRLGALGELAGERLRALEQLVERPAGDLVLVEREDGVAALVGPSHRSIVTGPTAPRA